MSVPARPTVWTAMVALAALHSPGYGQTPNPPGGAPPSPQTRDHDAGQPDKPEGGDEIADMSLEQLMEVKVVEVMSVAGVKKPLQATPAAVYVITGEDIRRAGHRHVAEALRMVPGMTVGRIDSHRWAVASRGFSSEFANKLLVLVDGRAVYSPFFSGVYWDLQNLVIEDIDRIEVIRGPGATLWGANAVNGVINIVTKHARDTQGALLVGGAGTEERGFGVARYGGALDERAYLRIYGQHGDRDSTVDRWDRVQHDDWNMSNGGWRFDGEGKDGYSLTLQGDAFGTDDAGHRMEIPTLALPFTRTSIGDDQYAGGNTLLRINRDMTPDSGWSLQTYFDRQRRVTAEFDEVRNTFDLEFKHHFAASQRQALIWGIDYRYTHDNIDPTFSFSMDPTSTSHDMISAFVQDTIALVPDCLSLMIGSKFEYNDFTGFEAQPGARLAWTPDEKQTIWTSVARAVRTPSRVERDIDLTLAVVPIPVPTQLQLLGDDDVDSEELFAYEAGYRVKATPRLTFDAAVFYNDYDRLVSVKPVPFDPLDLVFANNQTGESYGTELAATWDVTDKWRLVGSYSFFRHLLHRGEEGAEDNEPHNQASLRSELDITENLELNSALYYVDARQATNIPSFVRVDVGLTWRPKKNLEISIWGQNLADDRHPEFIDTYEAGRPAEIERGVYAMVKLSF